MITDIFEQLLNKFYKNCKFLMCFAHILVITSIIVPYLLCAWGMLLTIEIKKRCGNMSTIWAVCKLVKAYVFLKTHVGLAYEYQREA